MPHITNYEQFFLDLKSKGISYAAEHTLSLGFDAVEFLALGAEAPEFDDKEASRVLAAAKLPVSCFSVGLNVYAETKSERDKAEAALFRYAEAAATVGSPFLHHTLLFPLAPWEGAPDFSEALPLVADSAERVARYAQDLGITCLYEPQGIYFNGDGLSVFLAEMQKRCPNVGVCGDVGNPYFVDADPVSILKRHQKDVRHVHLKDYAIASSRFKEGTSYPSLGGRWLQDKVLGEGNIPLADCVLPLLEGGYTGDFAVEHSGSDEAVLRDIAYTRSLLSAFDNK